MPLLGQAALAMWWNMASTQRVEFEDWHSHEHFPERLAIPGFRRASRWASVENGEGFFVLYELEKYETLSSPPYLARLNDPTPWSVKMMPHHRDMIRSQCRIVESFGGGVAGLVLTIRLSPQDDRGEMLRAHLRAVLQSLPNRPGLTGGHLLQTQTPALAMTQEQKIRGGRDHAADWIVLVAGYDRDAVGAVAAQELDPHSLMAQGAQATPVVALFRLAYTAMANEA